MEYCRNGWPDRHTLKPETEPYWPVRGELTEGEGLLLYGGRIVVPALLQDETLQKLHRGIKGLSAADYERSHPFGGEASLTRSQILSATALNVAETHSHVESHS